MWLVVKTRVLVWVSRIVWGAEFRAEFCRVEFDPKPEALQTLNLKP